MFAAAAPHDDVGDRVARRSAQEGRALWRRAAPAVGLVHRFGGQRRNEHAAAERDDGGDEARRNGGEPADRGAEQEGGPAEQAPHAARTGIGMGPRAELPSARPEPPGPPAVPRRYPASEPGASPLATGKPSAAHPAMPPGMVFTRRPSRAKRSAARSAPLQCGPAQ